MSSAINRRDFLKLAGLVPLSLALPPLARPSGLRQLSRQQENVLIVVFDALSAYNMSLYGYARQTTPNIDRLAKRAIIYHDHYSAGNFTTPSTASLLTGVYPWTHRAIQFRGRTIAPFHEQNAFSVFEDYYRFAYTHNGWAQVVLKSMASRLNELPAAEDLYLESAPEFIRNILPRDDDIATVAWGRSTALGFDRYAYSLYLSILLMVTRDRASIREVRRIFPRGMPGDGEISTFILETAISWLAEEVARLPHPFFGYVHLLPPHAPYCTRIDFVDRFRDDGNDPPPKPADLFAAAVVRDEPGERRLYDEYILYADSEFGRLYEALESSGVLQNTWLVLTADHGELFERGLKAHGTDTLYEPEIRVPLMIFEPGREVGMEVHAPGSAVDLLATLAHVTGHALPPWTEGAVLPPYAEDAEDTDHSVYALMAADNNPLKPMKNATAAILKGRHKLQYYYGYRRLGGRELVKLFDIEADPEELVDLASVHTGLASELLAELKAKISEADQPYVGS